MTANISECFVWVIDDPSGIHGVPAFDDGNGRTIPMFSTRRHIAEAMRNIAIRAAEISGFPIELHRFEAVEQQVIERIVPSLKGGHA